MVDLLLQRFNEGLHMRLLIYESYLPKAKLKFQSFKKLPEIRWTDNVHGHVGVSDNAAVLTIRRNDGTFSYEAFVGDDLSFLKFTEDLFEYEWERAKPWSP
jgi:predicted transcriptional regulator